MKSCQTTTTTKPKNFDSFWLELHTYSLLDGGTCPGLTLVSIPKWAVLGSPGRGVVHMQTWELEPAFSSAPGAMNPRVYAMGIGPSFVLCLRLSTHPFHPSRRGGAAYLEGREISTFPSGSFCLPRFGATVLAAQSFLVTGVEGVLVPSDNPVQSPPPWVTGSGI